MDGLSITKYLQYVPNFYGVFSRNTLPDHISINHGLICNTDPSDKPGEHWVAFFRDDTGICEFFDPYGLPPLYDEFMTFLNGNSTVGTEWSHQQLQCVECVTCGLYCIEYIKYRCNGFSLNTFLNSFSSDTYVNDVIIEHRINNPIL